MAENLCRECGKPLTGDEIAIYKRMVNRGADSFLCIPCLSRFFKVDEARVREKVEHFRRQGCTLFSQTAPPR
ncbi:MAG TPA: hypothetical protein H9684_05110 [Firmicutes bacterium]|nr:hypothetical protein [Bacillota bacterium]